MWPNVKLLWPLAVITVIGLLADTGGLLSRGGLCQWRIGQVICIRLSGRLTEHSKRGLIMLLDTMFM